MGNNKPIIAWQKWVDPFGSELDDAKWTDYNDEIIDDIPGSEIPDNGVTINKDSVRVIASPMGLIPYNEHTASGKIFNFWLGHTNFTISDKIVETIESVDGVEILDIFTRYRFRIAIGKCFEESIVKHNINNIVYSYVNQEHNK